MFDLELTQVALWTAQGLVKQNESLSSDDNRGRAMPSRESAKQPRAEQVTVLSDTMAAANSAKNAMEAAEVEAEACLSKVRGEVDVVAASGLAQAVTSSDEVLAASASRDQVRRKRRLERAGRAANAKRAANNWHREEASRFGVMVMSGNARRDSAVAASAGARFC